MVEQSPLTSTEKRYLNSYNGNSDWSRFVQDFLVVAGFWFVAVYFLTHVLWRWLTSAENAYDNQVLIILVSIPVSMLIALWTLRAETMLLFKPPQIENNPYAADLAGGVASVQTLQIRQVMEIEEYDDEGAGFLLELESGGVLCLMSQDYYEYVSDIDLEEDEPDLRGDFPQTVIEYRYAPNSGLALNATGVGESLRPTMKIPRCPKVRKDKNTGKREYYGPEDGTFYPGTINDLCRQFGYRPVKI